MVRSSAGYGIASLPARESALQATARGDAALLARAIERSNPADLVLWRGHTLVHVAVALEESDCVRLLLSSGFPMDARSEFGTTPLMLACEAGAVSLCKLLVSKGADPNARDLEGNTPMIRGVAAGHVDIASVMRDLGGDPEIENDLGQRAVEVALRQGNTKSAADLGGRAIVVVPGFISPKVQSIRRSGGVLLDAVFYVGDVVTDLLLIKQFYDAGQESYAWIVLSLVMLPAVIMALVPHQSLFERLLSLTLLRFLWESVISLGQDRFTVRWGTLRMLTAVFEDIPQLVFQLGLAVQSGTIAQTPLLLVSIGFGLFQISRTIREMYFLQYFCKVEGDDDSEPEGLWFLSTINAGANVCVRIAMWLSVVIMATILSAGPAFAAAVLFVFVSRAHIARLHHVPLMPLDVVLSVIFDGVLSADTEAFAVVTMLSSGETALLLLLPVGIKFVEIDGIPWITLISTLGGLLAAQLVTSLCLYGSLPRLGLRTTPLWHDLMLWTSFVPAMRMLGAALRMLPENAMLLAKRAYRFLRAWALALAHDVRTAVKTRGPANHPQANDLHNNKVKADVENPQFAPALENNNEGTSEAPPLPPRTPPETSATTAPEREEGVRPQKCGDVWRESRQRGGICTLFLFAAWVGLQLGCLVPWLMGSPDAAPFDLAAWQSGYSASVSNDTLRAGRYVSGGGVPGFLPYCLAVGPYPWAIWGLVILGVLYLIYFIEAMSCRSAQYLKAMRSAEAGFKESLAHMKVAPSFNWYLENYHYETRTTYYTDSNGNRQTRTEQVKVVSHTAHGHWSYDLHWDVNDQYPLFDGLCRVKFDHAYEFADATTDNLHQSEFNEWVRQNDNHDTYKTVSESVRLSESTSHIAYDPGTAPYFLRFTYYFYASLILCSLWFRIWMVASSSKVTVRMVKKVWKAG